MDMNKLQQDLIRMELQIGQLIHITANLNERLNRLEKAENQKKTMFMNRAAPIERM
ncbi:hypothetical protein [Sporosarcina sp. HYO08]|uniref:hypothetical protein n=1 Tax=Sporosarcina sp. HYO08 TaxID=1759557 RepID=UPI0012E39F94|nr:hypothetical protein [Sporosarcina sp. HYO08]